MKKIGILYICTGRYSLFFKQFYESSENFFMKDHEKTYYVFTDDSNIKESHNVKIINQPFLGWPYDTMKRFHMFNSIKNKLLNEDYLFFFNANMRFFDYVNEEIIPKKENDFLVGVNHPGFYASPKEHFPYERRINSLFYIPLTDGKYYYQGCFNGGKSDNFLEASKTLSIMIDKDFENDIIPIYHDESALNWYFKDKNPLLMSPSYAYPESWSLPLKRIIVQIDKAKVGGYDYLRQI
jgi:hypothetical protein